MSDELLLKNGLVVTVDDRLGDLQDADVLIRDGVIIAVGSSVPTASADAEVIDCKGRLVIPGLIDTHRHVWQGAIGALTPQMTGAGYGPAVLNGISTSYPLPAAIGHLRPHADGLCKTRAEQAVQDRLSALDAEQRRLDKLLDKNLTICAAARPEQ